MSSRRSPSVSSMWLWGLFAGVVASGLVALGARALRDFSRHELEEICRRRNRLDRLGDILRRHDDVGLAVEMLRLVCVAAVALAAAYAESFQPSDGEWPWVSPTLRIAG